jgi:protein-disulfide isomerase
VSEGYSAPRLTLPVGARDHVQGAPGARRVLVEYGDYQCPYCGAAYPVVKRVQKELGAELRFVFRNFPLTNLHPRAAWAAETAEAVGAQGKYWEMHDFLFENQRSFDDEGPFARFEEKLKLDAPRVAREVARRAYAARIEEDFASGVRSGVNGTPTFFIDGVRYDGPAEFEALVAELREPASAGRRARTRRD